MNNSFFSIFINKYAFTFALRTWESRGRRLDRQTGTKLNLFKKTNKTKRGEGVPLTIIIEMNNTEIKTGKSYVKVTLEMKHFQLCIYMLKVFKKWNALKWYKIWHFHNSHYQSVTKCTHLNKLF